MSSLTTYYSSKLINKTNILFVLSPPLFKKIFFLSLFLSSLSFLPFLPITVSPYQNFFSLSSSSLFSSPLLWSVSLFFFFYFFVFFFSSLFLSSIQCFFLFSFSFFPSLFSPVLFPFHQWIMVVVDLGSWLRFGLVLVDLVGFRFVIGFWFGLRLWVVS